MDAYDLFTAMNGVDEELLHRSQRRRKPHSSWLFPMIAATCFAAIMLSLLILPAKRLPITLSTEPAFTESISTEPSLPPLRLNGGSTGTLNIVQLSRSSESPVMPDFLIYINQEHFAITESAGIHYIIPKAPPSGMPMCQMTIEWQPGISVENAAMEQAGLLEETMSQVSPPEEAGIVDGLKVCGSDGSDPLSLQQDAYILSDSSDGVFVFTLSYYTDAAQSHAARFLEMLQTFEVISAPGQAPQWMSDLLSSVMRLTPAFLKNDFSSVQDLLSESAQLYTYDEDVYADAGVYNVYYEVDNGQTPTSAYVSIRHKYISSDAYDYITMEWHYLNGSWQVAFAGIEP